MLNRVRGMKMSIENVVRVSDDRLHDLISRHGHLVVSKALFERSDIDYNVMLRKYGYAPYTSVEELSKSPALIYYIRIFPGDRE